MEKTIILENGSNLTYVESFWKQSKKIFINGKEIRKYLKLSLFMVKIMKISLL